MKFGENRNTLMSLKSTRIEPDISRYKGLDTGKYKYWGIRTTNVYDDDTKLSSLVGIDKSGLKHVIVDVNFNNDFRDDRDYVFDPAAPKASPVITLYPARPFNRNLYRQLALNAFPSGQFSSYAVDAKGNNAVLQKGSAREELELEYRDETYLQGILKTVEGETTIYVKIREFSDSERKFELVLAQKNKLPTERHIYDSDRDSILIGSFLYKADSLKEGKLFLTRLSKARHQYGAVNTNAPDFKGKDLFTNRQLSLKQYRGSYLIIDFWGSWCDPCIEALPELVRLHKKYTHVGLKILSIAADRDSDIDKLKAMIKKQKLNWDHIIVGRGGTHAIVRDYHIQTYPTTIMIDSNGKIVKREIGLTALKSIDNYLIKNNLKLHNNKR